MRILHVSDNYPPQVGGLELQVQQLTQELARRGHEVRVATLAGRQPAGVELDGDVAVHRIAGWSRTLNTVYGDPSWPFHPTLPDPGVVRALRAVIKEFRPHVVHAHSWIIYSVLPIVPSATTRLVATLHDYGLVCPKKTMDFRGRLCAGPNFLKCVSCANKQYGAFESLALTSGIAAMRPWRGRVDQYIAISRAVAESCSPLVLPGRRPIVLIPPFLANRPDDPSPGRRANFVPANGDYLLFAGALSRHKGLKILLEAWAGLSPTVPLVLAGLRRPDTPTSLPPGVILAENVPHTELARAWRYCTAALVPSVWPEPFGLVALEAMAAGRPVVASSVGGLPDLVVNGVTGLLVPPNDVLALRAAVQQVIDNPQARLAMGAAAQRQAARFTANEVVPQIEHVYREVLERGANQFRGPSQRVSTRLADS